MKTAIYILSLMMLTTTVVSAQWSGPTSNGSLYYAGKVGIGTNDTWDLLTVAGDLTLFNPVSNTNTYVSGLNFSNPLISGPNSTSNLARIYVTTSGAHYASNLIFDIRSGSSTYEAMRIMHNGFLGVGTASPSERLDVSGKIKVSTNGSDYGLMYHTSNFEETGYNNVWPDNNERALMFKANAYLDGYGAGGGGLQFWTYDQESGGEWGSYTGGLKRAMVIRRNGNVGIGTVNPGSFKLAVNGKVSCEELQVVVDIADYVFTDDYNLKPLEEVEAYIKANKHLPGVPGKAEVAANGFQVGLMTNKVLEKVEELTLYVIELKNENKELKKENEDLKERVSKLEHK